MMRQAADQPGNVYEIPHQQSRRGGEDSAQREQDQSGKAAEPSQAETGGYRPKPKEIHQRRIQCEGSEVQRRQGRGKGQHGEGCRDRGHRHTQKAPLRRTEGGKHAPGQRACQEDHPRHR